MLAKRVGLTLLYESGHFCISRNFRLQRVGKLKWLIDNYGLDNVGCFIDDLTIIDCSKNTTRQSEDFIEDVKKILELVYIPVSIGGGINNELQVDKLFNIGADRVILTNQLLKNENNIIEKIAERYGNQSLVGKIDVRNGINNEYFIYSNDGDRKIESTNIFVNRNYLTSRLGELIVCSINQDGTGQGLDLNSISDIQDKITTPIVLMGGISKAEQIVDGLQNPRVSGVTTSNLFNFLGNGLKNARSHVIRSGINIASWDDPREIKINIENTR